MRVLDTLDLNGNKVTNLAAPTADGDAANRAYVLAQISGAGGMTQEQVEDIAGAQFTTTHSRITFTYDDTTSKITATVTDSPLLGGQTLAQVRAGIDAATLGGSTRAQVVSEAIAGVVDTAPATLDTLNELAAALGDDANFATTVNTSLAARVRDYRQTLSTSATSYTITHNLGTRDVDVTVYEAAGNYEEVWCTVRRPTINTVTLLFAAAPAAGQYRVVCMGRPD